MEEIV
jgi:uncharacterized membrane protein YdjX (TVP38/TMEM64 family)